MHRLKPGGGNVPCGFPGCKNRADTISWLEVVKDVTKPGLCFVSLGRFFCLSFVFLMYVVLCFLVFGCQYQCNRLSGKTSLQNDLLCVEWNVKTYQLTHPGVEETPSRCTQTLLVIWQLTSIIKTVKHASVDVLLLLSSYFFYLKCMI